MPCAWPVLEAERGDIVLLQTELENIFEAVKGVRDSMPVCLHS